MKKQLLFCLSLLLATVCYTQSLKQIEATRIKLHNGWSVTPVGKSINLGDLPLNIAISPSKKLLAVTNNGQSDQTIQLIDVAKEKVLDTILIGKSWLGLVFSDDEKLLYASGGNDNWIIRYDVSNKHLVPKDTFVLGKPWPERISPAGMALDDAKHLLYVVTRENNELYVIDVVSKKIVKQLPLGAEGYTCLLSPDKKMLYISCWGCNKVELFNTEKQKFAASVMVGGNPNDLCLKKDGSILFVSNSQDNSVSVIDVKQQKVIETLNAALYPDAPTGSTSNSVALSEDDKTLYIANADNNCLAVFDVSNPGACKSKGFIPTGWYPTCVRQINKDILVANGKGFQSFANPYGPNPMAKNQKVLYRKSDPNRPAKEQYIGGLFRGKLSIIPIPDEKQLAIYSQVVYNNTPYHKDEELVNQSPEGNPIPDKVGKPSPIKYVFYCIKENRTYDQVLGDVKAGNGDTSLCLFGQKITPNEHAIVQDFVLLDNFYVDGTVSADGHNWSTGAYANDYLEKQWPSTYSGRGGDYSGEGEREIANNRNGFIWDFCKRYGVTYRTYGEFADPPDKAHIPVLINHIATKFNTFDGDIKDTIRFAEWKQDFDSLLAINQVPQLSTLRFPNDHTSGLQLGKPTPFAAVADNDLAVGMLIDYLSHTRIWKECAIFIVEDDAQAGPDHVDAHRTTAYVAGGFVKHGFVDHTMYSTSSMLRTMELILGLPPMSQYDAAAMPMYRSFDNSPNHAAYNALPEQINLKDVNVAVNEWEKRSEQFDFRKEDLVPEAQLNQVIWVAVKGENSVCPAPKHAAFINLNGKIDGDDDGDGDDR